MKKILALALCLCLVLACFSGCGQSGSEYTVGICQFMEHGALDAATEGFKAALTEKLGDKVAFVEKNAQGEQTNCGTIVNKFVADGVDLIMANATPALTAAREATNTIPVIGTSVTQYVPDFVADDQAPGGNITGASDLNPVDVQVRLMDALCPGVETVGIVISSGEVNSQVQADEAKAAFEKAGKTVKIYTAADSNDLQAVFTKACEEVDAFYEPTDNLVANNMEIVKNVTVPAKKPVICGEGNMCEAGGLATYSISYYKLGYAAGLQAYEILANGADPGALPIEYMGNDDLELVVNQEVADGLGITIPEELQAP